MVYFYTPQNNPFFVSIARSIQSLTSSTLLRKASRNFSVVKAPPGGRTAFGGGERVIEGRGWKGSVAGLMVT